MSMAMVRRSGSSHDIATSGSRIFDLRSLDALVSGASHTSRSRSEVFPTVSPFPVGGTKLAYLQVGSPSPHRAGATIMIPSVGQGDRTSSEASPEHVDATASSSFVERVSSPEYDHEVIFTTMLAVNVDDLPELEPRIRPAHSPTT